ncbi:MerR family transcriptional regulator [Phaeobacter gallaeciensis]|uniref:MerR family transcriptional regulator n=1 Tax=Phaeobacter gallaeciensis TaxID=60890 RepID=UPI000BBC9D6C|nr:MerR family transcriptional regulator [Phaeobacter gallaeciensis]ATF18836.1 putative transcriptional regulator [Phaeobacter gallaeciensis]ATF22945.1 putative transcriptional regulator [Phaeobacter gallaeciensis]
MSKSPDAFRTISEVAEWLGIQAHVLRFWESKFTQIKPVKRAGGRRYYRPADVELLGSIKTLLHDKGLSIKDVQALLREHGPAHVAAMGAGDIPAAEAEDVSPAPSTGEMVIEGEVSPPEEVAVAEVQAEVQADPLIQADGPADATPQEALAATKPPLTASAEAAQVTEAPAQSLQTAQAEPVQTQPGQVQPGPVQPAQAQQAQTQPTQVQPAQAQPGLTDPTPGVPSVSAAPATASPPTGAPITAAPATPSVAVPAADSGAPSTPGPAAAAPAPTAAASAPLAPADPTPLVPPQGETPVEAQTETPPVAPATPAAEDGTSAAVEPAFDATPTSPSMPAPSMPATAPPAGGVPTAADPMDTAVSQTGSLHPPAAPTSETAIPAAPVPTGEMTSEVVGETPVGMTGGTPGDAAGAPAAPPAAPMATPAASPPEPSPPPSTAMGAPVADTAAPAPEAPSESPAMAAQPGLPLDVADQTPDAAVTAGEDYATAPADIDQDVATKTDLDAPAPEQGQLWDATLEVSEVGGADPVAALPTETETAAEDVDVPLDAAELMAPAAETVASVASLEVDAVEGDAVEVEADPTPAAEPSLGPVETGTDVETVAAVDETAAESTSPWSDEDAPDQPVIDERVSAVEAVASQAPDLITAPETASAPAAPLHEAPETVEATVPETADTEIAGPETSAPDAASEGNVPDPVVFDQGDSPAPVVEALDSDPVLADVVAPEQVAAVEAERLSEPPSDLGDTLAEAEPLVSGMEVPAAEDEPLADAMDAVDAHVDHLADDDEALSPEDNPLTFADEVEVETETLELPAEVPMQAAETPEPHAEEPNLVETVGLPEVAETSTVAADASNLDAPTLDDTVVSDPVMSAPAVSDNLLETPLAEDAALQEPEQVVADLADAEDAPLPEPAAVPAAEETPDVMAEMLELAAPAELGEPVKLTAPAEIGAPAELTETAPDITPQADIPEVAAEVTAEETTTALQGDLSEGAAPDPELSALGVQDAESPQVAPAAAADMPEPEQDVSEPDGPAPAEADLGGADVSEVDLTEPAPFVADTLDQESVDTGEDQGDPDLGTPDLIDPELVATDPAEAEPPIADEVEQSAAPEPKPLVIDIPDEAEPHAPQASGVLARLAGVDHLPADHIAEARACAERLRTHQGAA